MSTAPQSGCVTSMRSSAAGEISLSDLLISFTAQKINLLTLGVGGSADSFPSAAPQWILFLLRWMWNSVRGRGRRRSGEGSKGSEERGTSGWMNFLARFYRLVLHLRNDDLP